MTTTSPLTPATATAAATTPITTVVLDMAGTTVVDDGLVIEAFTRAWDRVRTQDADADARATAVQWVIDTMGQSKIDVFRHLLPEDEAQRLNTAFEASYDDLVDEGRSVAIEGARATIDALRADGRRVVLTTGFARRTADNIVASLGWSDAVDHVLTPADAGRGRPHPDLNLLAVLRTEAASVASLAVVGDTPSDIASGRAAGAGLVVGVLTGATSPEQFAAAGADAVIASVADLPGILDRLAR